MPSALSLAVLVLLVLVNLRGVRESGYAFALPTYAFIGSVGALVAIGFVRGLVSGWPTAHVPDPAPVGLAGSVGLIVLLRAFASGCSALTGVEAISNGVPAFRRPQAAERVADADGDGRHRDPAVHRRVAARVEDRRPAERIGLGALRDRARRLPAWQHVVRLLPRAGEHRRRARARREHGVPGLPAPGGAARERQLPPAPVREPRRPAGLLERDRRAGRRRGRPDRRLQRRRQQPDPPVPARRLHGLHALAVRDGAALVHAPRNAERARLGRGRAERRRRAPDRAGRRDRARHQVHRGRLDGDDRDPRAGARLRADQPPLPRRHVAAARAGGHSASACRRRRAGRALRGRARRRDRRGGAVRALRGRRALPGGARQRCERDLERVARVQRHVGAAGRAASQRHRVGHGCRMGARGRARAGRDHHARRSRAVPVALAERRLPRPDRAGPAAAPAGRARHRRHRRAGRGASPGAPDRDRPRGTQDDGAAADRERRRGVATRDRVRARPRRERRTGPAHRARR